MLHRRPSKAWAGAALALLLPACAPSAPDAGAADLEASVEAWRERRIAALTRPDGWLSLVALHWLEPGETTFGSDPGSGLALAEAAGATPLPPRLGVFRLEEDGSVVFVAEPGVEVLEGEGPVESVLLLPSAAERAVEAATTDAPVLAWGPLLWHVMVRQDRPVVRVKSAESPVLTGFEGIDHFPVAAAWRIEGRFEAYEPPKEILVPNILGGDSPTPARGAAVFEVDGRTWRLDLWEDSDDPANHFTAFGDETNGQSSYGGGRFLWIDAPAPGDDRIVIDFNRAYNPPCVFTPYSTCPLPPRQNRLPFPVEAGEKEWGRH